MNAVRRNIAAAVLATGMCIAGCSNGSSSHAVVDDPSDSAALRATKHDLRDARDRIASLESENHKLHDENNSLKSENKRLAKRLKDDEGGVNVRVKW